MMPNEIATEAAPLSGSDVSKLQFDYAWKWFCYHAEQRIKMFNFMLLVFGVVAAGVVNAFGKEGATVAIASLCFLAFILAVIFVLLDRRNRDLVWLGEDVLIYLERQVIFGKDENIQGRYGRTRTLGILWRQELENRRSKSGRVCGCLRSAWLGKHRIWMPLIGGIFALEFLAAGIWILSKS
jgi:hypothetical protein